MRDVTTINVRIGARHSVLKENTVPNGMAIVDGFYSPDQSLVRIDAGFRPARESAKGEQI